VVADGIHRLSAFGAEGHTEIRAIIVEPRLGDAPLVCAFRRGLETAAHAPVPLSRTERTRAVRMMLERQPQLSDHEIANLCGSSRQTVWRYRTGRCNATLDETFQRMASMPRLPTADELARDLVVRLVRLDDGRGIFDRINPKRMGRHLGQAFVNEVGDQALDRARRYAAWLNATITVLEREAEMS
jgi:hypothetical protein